MMTKMSGRARGVLKLFSLGAMLALAACAGDGRYAATGDDGGPAPRDFRDLKDWNRDNHAEAIPALLRTCAYLRSLFQADGYVTVRENAARVGFDAIGARWAEQLQILLHSVGIFSRRGEKLDPRANRHSRAATAPT